ncbi:MAG: hypothetical protein K0S08_497 [Gammaproteobacteria bacterium]|jgi:hypothetical protein|nr:hypothetical protein [Gammaproteobacteria bacterium]
MLTCFEIDSDFISEIDKFLLAFDQKKAELSDTQQDEVKKFQRIGKLRDEKETPASNY